MKSYLNFELKGNDLGRDGEAINLKKPIKRSSAKEAEASIVISHYNGHDTLPLAIRSVLRQQIRNLGIEMVVVDDGSSGDEFASAMAEFASLPNLTTVLLQSNTGATLSRNLGIFLSNGEFIIPLDADDEIIGDNVVRSLIQHFREAKGAVFASTNMLGDIGGAINETDDIKWVRELPVVEGATIEERFAGRDLYLREAKDYNLWKLLEYDYNIGLRLFPKKLLEKIGGLDEALGTQCWYSAILELRQMGQFIPVREDAYLYRVHGRNISRKQSEERLSAVKKFMLDFFKRYGIGYEDLRQNCSDVFWKVRGITKADFK